jgi:hypothetical protein
VHRYNTAAKLTATDNTKEVESGITVLILLRKLVRTVLPKTVKTKKISQCLVQNSIFEIWGKPENRAIFLFIARFCRFINQFLAGFYFKLIF